MGPPLWLLASSGLWDAEASELPWSCQLGSVWERDRVIPAPGPVGLEEREMGWGEGS